MLWTWFTSINEISPEPLKLKELNAALKSRSLEKGTSSSLQSYKSNPSIWPSRIHRDVNMSVKSSESFSIYLFVVNNRIKRFNTANFHNKRKDEERYDGIITRELRIFVFSPAAHCGGSLRRSRAKLGNSVSCPRKPRKFARTSSLKLLNLNFDCKMTTQT